MFLLMETVFSFNFWKAASIVSLGEAKNGFIFGVKLWLRVWSQNLSFWSLWQIISAWLVLEAAGCEQSGLSSICKRVAGHTHWRSFFGAAAFLVVLDRLCFF